MIGVKVEVFPDKVGEAREVIRKFSVRKIYRMSGFQKAVERDSMKHAPKGQASPAGTPPHTHGKTSKKTGKILPAFPQTIRFNVEEKGLQSRSVVGPTKPSTGKRSNWAERIGKTHEFGGTSTVEKKVVYRPVKPGEKGIWLPTGKKTKEGKDIRKEMRTSNPIPLFKSGGKEKVFPFTLHERKKMTKGRIMFKISYQATYPKRPFAAPALRKTIAATRQGKFG